LGQAPESGLRRRDYGEGRLPISLRCELRATGFASVDAFENDLEFNAWADSILPS
jgi:hypothetical protein